MTVPGTATGTGTGTVGGGELRSVLRAHAAGVAVLTAADEAGPVGVTVTSFTSVSANPALVSVTLAETSTTWARVKDCGRFGIQLLGAHQAETAMRFARPGDRFAPPTAWHPGPHGVPLLDDCLSWLVCSPYEQLRLGDHHLLVGAVEYARHGTPGDSLVHLHRDLRPVTAPTPART
ncbi:flavin reductase family protein [Streptomyces brevispora]|uniref:Flavin reductase family protein n=1 Tax=Streptomyces brevispora TaxID=887462 RepID=A0ABZ1GAK9_9ACTN|nr:flavin reductase family protein [Streptomyces brevispora]WSC16960.1 flavin reductase family protein [Streptomyces brevispora]